MYNNKAKEARDSDTLRFERELSMVGITIERMKYYCDSHLKMGTYQMLAMSMMSDAQEAMERDQLEFARQVLNRAKWVLSTYQVRV